LPSPLKQLPKVSIWTGSGLTVLIENTAGAEFSLGGTFEQVAELLERLGGIVPVAACIDTCHVHVAGYDLVSQEGMRLTLAHLEATVGLQNVRVWHCNDAKAARGSRLDRHEHVGKGQSGEAGFPEIAERSPPGTCGLHCRNTD
jgi:deoxyribonuclease-4